MAHHIDKAAVVAEIKKRRDSFYSLSKSCEKGTPAKAGFYAQAQTLEGILSFLDTLEVKEVNSNDAFIEKACEWLDKHLLDYWQQVNTDTKNFIDDFRKAMEE